MLRGKLIDIKKNRMEITEMENRPVGRLLAGWAKGANSIAEKCNPIKKDTSARLNRARDLGHATALKMRPLDVGLKRELYSRKDKKSYWEWEQTAADGVEMYTKRWLKYLCIM